MKKRLYRSRKEKIIGGVAGGFAEYFDIDPVIARIAFVVMVFFNGLGLILYLLCLIVIPKEPLFFNAEQRNSEPEQEEINIMGIKTNTRQKVFGGILIILGLFFLLDNIIPSFGFDYFFPVIVICVGIWILLNAQDKRNISHENE